MPHEDIDLPLFVARLRERESDALGKAVDLNLPQMLRAARASGLPAQQAEDIVQEAFATFIEKIAEFEGRSRVRSWLFGILYRKILEAARQMNRDRHFDVAEADQSRFRPDGTWTRPPLAVDMAVYSREIREHICACLEGVPQKQRMAFVLREVDSMETGEICEILDITPANFGVLIHRARNRLRDCLEAKGIGGSKP